MLKKQRVYLAGEVHDDDFAEKKFSAVESRLRNYGFAVINPYNVISQLPREVIGNEDECTVIKNAMLSLCSNVVVLDGSEKTDEVERDLQYARENNIDITLEKEIKEQFL